MAGVSNLLALARDSLGAQAFALDVTGQNIANANTPGYVRRSATLETKIAGTVTYGGVEATGIRRAYDKFLSARTDDASSLASSAQSHDQALGTIEGMFNDAQGSGFAPSIQALFSSFSSLSASPSDPTARSQVLASAQDFATRMNETSAGITSLRSDLYTQAAGKVTEINGYTSQIAKLNKQVALAEDMGSDASDLKDARDKAVSDLSERIDVHAFTDSTGRFVIASSGTTLVDGVNAHTLSITKANDGSIKLLADRAGGASADITSHLTGGSLAGIREARDVDAVQVSQKVDQLAYDVTTAINTQHAAGFGLDGVSGRALFAVSGPAGAAATLSLDPNMAGHPERVAASGSIAGLPGSSDNAVALAGLSSKPIAGGGTRTASDAYSDLVGDVGQRKATSAQTSTLRDAIKGQATAMRDSVSGVSMDEEMVALSRYQRAYEASSKLLQVSDQLLQSLIQMV